MMETSEWMNLILSQQGRKVPNWKGDQSTNFPRPRRFDDVYLISGRIILSQLIVPLASIGITNRRRRRKITLQIAPFFLFQHSYRFSLNCSHLRFGEKVWSDDTKIPKCVEW